MQMQTHPYSPRPSRHSLGLLTSCQDTLTAKTPVHPRATQADVAQRQPFGRMPVLARQARVVPRQPLLDRLPPADPLHVPSVSVNVAHTIGQGKELVKRPKFLEGDGPDSRRERVRGGGVGTGLRAWSAPGRSSSRAARAGATSSRRPASYSVSLSGCCADCGAGPALTGSTPAGTASTAPEAAARRARARVRAASAAAAPSAGGTTPPRLFAAISITRNAALTRISGLTHNAPRNVARTTVSASVNSPPTA